jgi:lipopolysaccharide biosynthesis glycosyltransferase
VPYCGVAVSSLIQNTNVNNLYEVYVLYDELKNTNIRRLEGLSVNHVTVRCVCIHEYVVNLKVTEYNHLTVASAYRLVIPDALPQYDKIIYLDSDIAVNADIAEMYNFDIGNNVLGAVKGLYDEDDIFSEYMSGTLHVSKDTFFNAGILIINCAEFRKKNIKEKCFALLTERTDLLYMDQDALNIICQGNVYFLPKEWNYECVFLFNNNTCNDDVMSDSAIVHYDGIDKPWNHPERPLSEQFWSYARKTIFYEEILMKVMRAEMASLVHDTHEIFGNVRRFDNTAIYGAGHVGTIYVNRLLEMRVCNIVAWVDKNFAEKKGTVLPVESVDKLYTTDFDCLIIAIADKDKADEVENMLIANNIEKEKIVRIN